MATARPETRIALWALVLAVSWCLTACGTRVISATGTTLGLKASPGDGQTRPPQVTFGYKRAEVAMVPTNGQKGTETSDAFSTLATFHLKSEWFGKTEVASFIGTGMASRDILGGTAFKQAFAAASLGAVPQAIQDRRKQLVGQLGSLTDDQAKRVLDLTGLAVQPGKTATQSLQAAILDAQTDPQLTKLGDAFNRVR